MTEIRQPFGPGVGDQPGIPDPTPEVAAPAVSEAATLPSTIQPQAPTGVGSPEWWDSQQIEPARANRILSDEAMGHVGQLPTFEWAATRVSPRNLTAQDPRFPLPLEQLGPVDIPKRSGEGTHVGNINFDFIDPRTSFNELGGHVGNESLGDDVFQFLNARDIDLLAWDIPSRMMDYAVALPLAWLGAPFGDNSIPNQILDALGQAEDKDQWWAFQQTDAYWQWLGTAGEGGGFATPEQVKQQAYQMSRETWGGNRNVMAMQALERQMMLDQQKLSGLSSGSHRTDWIAKSATVNTWPGLDHYHEDMTPIERAQLADEMIAKMWAYDPDLPQDKDEVRGWILLGARSQRKWNPQQYAQTGNGWEGGEPETGSDYKPYDIGKQLINSAASMSAMFLPVVGTEIAEWADPTDRFQEAFWRAIDTDVRTNKIGQMQMATTMTDLGVAVATAVVAVPWVAAGSAAGASMPARAAWQTYQLSLNIGKVGLVAGVTTMTTNLALDWANPQYAATIGRKIDMARPVSNSFFAPMVNLTGIVTSGSLGVVPTLQIAKHVAGKGTRAARVSGLTGKWEPTAVQQYFGGGASKTSKAFADDLVFDPQIQQNATTATMSSYIANIDLKNQSRIIIDAINGVATGTELDLLVGAAKLKRIEQIMKTWDPQQAAAAGWQTIGIREAQPSLWTKLFDDAGMQSYKAARKASRTLDNDIAQTMVRDYAGYHGGTVEAITQSVTNRLRRIQKNFPEAMGGGADIDAAVKRVGGRVGDDVEELQRAGNRAHSIEFYLENGEMTAAAQGAEEAQRIHLIRQRTMTQEDVTEEVLQTLRGGDDAAMALKEELRMSKDEVSKALAGKDMAPDELAQYLEDMRPGYAIKRQLPDSTAATASDPLNVYHRRLVDDGEWDIGYIPYIDEAIPLPRNGKMPVLPDGTPNLPRANQGQIDTLTKDLVEMQEELVRMEQGLADDVAGSSVEAVEAQADAIAQMTDELQVLNDAPPYEIQALTSPPEGFRKIVPGEEFRTNREFIATVGDGIYVNIVDGETVRPLTTPGTFQNGSSVNILSEPNIAVVPKNIQDTMQWGAWFDGDGAVMSSPLDDQLIPLSGADGNPLVVSGGNYGADWPVLLAPDGSQWVFKAFRGSGGPDNLVSLGAGVVVTETRIGRLYSMVGLNGGASMPHTRTLPSGQQINGTIQPYYPDLQPVLEPGAMAASWELMTPDQQSAVMGHYMMDWLFSQMDTNPGSLYFNSQAKVIGVDKAQAFKYYDQGDWPPRLDFNPNREQFGQWTIQDALQELREAGINVDRGLIEDTLQKLESIPAEVFDQEMLQIGLARQADDVGDVMRAWKRDPVSFAKEMADRRLSMRTVMNDLFENELGSAGIPDPNAAVKFYKTGRPINHAPPFGGPTFRAKRFDLELLQDMASEADFVEPPIPDSGLMRRSGVVIAEEDGTIWLAEPTGHFDGYTAQTIKGNIEEGETLRQAAVREAREETGFDVMLDSHLIDYVDPDTGEIIRYYNATRIGGSPELVSKNIDTGGGVFESETLNLINGKPRDVESLIKSGLKKSGRDRDMAVMEAYLQGKSTGTLRHQIDDAPAGAIGNAGEELADMPGVTQETARRYVSYQRLGSGEYIRVPWVDQVLSAPGPQSLGNRTFIGGKLDSLFRGFRTWRIAETQKANLFRRMSRDYAGVTNHQVEAFTRELEHIAERHHVPVQFIGNMNTHVLQTAPMVGNAVREATIEAAEKIFGKILVNTQTGLAVPIRSVPWRDIIVKSHRQAFKHNLTAGFTSYVYSLPGGWAPALIGQGVWPMLKFTLSPIFKISEYAESGILNKMRGINGIPDDIIELYAPHMGFSRSQIAGEQGLSPMINGMGFGRYKGPGAASNNGIAFSLPGQSANVPRTSTGLRVWEDVLEEAPGIPNVSTDGVATYLKSDPLVVPASQYPKTLPDYTPQAMMPRRTNADGKTMLNPEVTEWDAARMADNQTHPMSWEQPLYTEADVDQAVRGLAVMQELGYERLDRLITAQPIFHNPGPDWGGALDFSDVGFQHGPRPTRLETGALKAEATQEQTLRWFGSEGNMGDDEGAQLLTLQAGQAKFATMGSRPGISGGDATIVLNHSVVKRALITDSDRIGTGFKYSGSGMSAHGLFANMRHNLMRSLSDIRPGDKMGSVLKSGAYHNELAIFDAPAWSEVDAIMFRDQAALDNFLTKLDAAPQEVKDAVQHVELRKIDSGEWGNDNWSKIADDYMWEKSGLSEIRDVEPIVRRDDTLLQLIDSDKLPKNVGPAMMRGIETRAQAAGWRIDRPMQTSNGRQSVMDDLTKQIEMFDEDIEKAAAKATAESLRTGKMGTADAELRKWQEKKRQALALYDDLEALRTSGRLGHTTAKEARATQSITLKGRAEAAPNENVEAFATARDQFGTSGDREGLMAWIRETPDLDLSVSERSTLANAVYDEYRIAEMTEQYVALKFNGHPAPVSAAMDTWEVFGGKLQAKHMATGETRAIKSEPIPLGDVGWSQRRDWVDARSTKKLLGDDIPANYTHTPTAYPAQLREEIAGPLFGERLHQEAIARLGYDPGAPIVDMYVRGTREGIKDGPVEGAVEIVIVAKAPDKGSLGLTLKEIEDIWMETGLPANKIGRHDVLGQIGWDDVNRQILMGDMDALQSTLDDGSTWLNGGYLKGTPVIFTDSFEHGGKAYRPLAGFSDGFFDPQLVREQIKGTNKMRIRSYESAEHTWTWDYQPEINHIGANVPVTGRIQKDATADQKFRDVWDFLRGEGSDRAWTMDVDVANDIVAAGALKRAWYLDEIPENVVMKDVQTQEIINNEWFQKAFGAPDDIGSLKQPRGLEDIPGTNENTNALFNRKMADELGVDEADLLAGDFDALAEKIASGEKRPGLLELLKNFMDPIPYKEGAMSRQAIVEMNAIFVGVLKETDHPALKVFRELGIADEDITNFLLQDRQLLETWLLHGRDVDLDRLMAHASKVSDDPSKARDTLDDLYSSTEYNTMTQMWRMSLKAAQDEAFGVHFFNPYRSFLERSLNHPTFGVYPLSWSLKAAREWARFLFDNRMLQGGKIRLGMTPAVAINEYNRKLNTFAAQQGMDVGELLSIWGPLGNQMMIFGLLMPGDWSSIPFPTSRTIRDIARGDMNPSNLYNDNMIGGIARDIRLGVGSVFEFRNMLDSVLPEDRWGTNPEPGPAVPRQQPAVRGRDINYTQP